MGSICSRTANQPEPNTQPGRVLGSSTGTGRGTTGKDRVAPPPAASSSSANRSKPNKSNFKSPGRTLGGEEPENGGDARQKAAGAAQVSLLYS